MNRGLLQQALDAILHMCDYYEYAKRGYDASLVRKSIEALEAELASQALDKKAANAQKLGLDYEPVASVTGYYGGRCVIQSHNTALVFSTGTTLYAASPRKEWVGLTDDEINRSISNLLEDDTDPLMTLAYVIEEQLRIKNER